MPITSSREPVLPILLRPMTTPQRLAMSAAVYFALDHRAEFSRRFGEYGWECLKEIGVGLDVGPERGTSI